MILTYPAGSNTDILSGLMGEKKKEKSHHLRSKIIGGSSGKGCQMITVHTPVSSSAANGTPGVSEQPPSLEQP